MWSGLRTRLFKEECKFAEAESPQATRMERFGWLLQRRHPPGHQLIATKNDRAQFKEEWKLPSGFLQGVGVDGKEGDPQRELLAAEFCLLAMVAVFCLLA